MKDKYKNVFVLAPHTDDGELGCGGTISKLCNENANVFYFAFSTAEQSVPDGFPKDILKTEVKNATAKLGIKSENLFIYNYEVRKLNYFRQDILEELVKKKKELQPDLVLMPSLHDIHQDHSTIAQEALRAFKTTTILGYELIWNNLSFNTTSFVALNKEHLDKKEAALQEYHSQGQRHYMNKDFVYSLAKLRGVQAGLEFAECFEVIRWIQE